MAEIAGIDKDCLTAWSQRSTRLREWAKHNLVVVDGEPTPAQLATAQKATRPAKPESLAWETLKDQWRVTTARVRSSNVDVIATVGQRAPWATTASPGSVND